MRIRTYHLAISAFFFFAACSPINKKNRIKKTFEAATAKLNDAYYEDAIVLFSKAIEMDHELVDAYMNRGVAYYESGHYALALADYNHVRMSKPDYDDILFNRAYAYLALKKYEMALEDLMYLKRLYPDTALVYNVEGYLYGEQENHEAAKASFDLATKKESGNFDSWTNLGVMNYHLKLYAEAESCFITALTIRGNAPEVLNPLSLVYLEQGLLNKADSTIDAAISLQANQAYFLNNKGLIQIRLGNYQLADSLIQESLKFDPENASAIDNQELLKSLQ